MLIVDKKSWVFGTLCRWISRSEAEIDSPGQKDKGLYAARCISDTIECGKEVRVMELD